MEERGLRAASRLAQADGPNAVPRAAPGSILGALLDRDGPGSLGDHLGQFADAAIVDSRVLLAHRVGAEEAGWPAAEDRFASDLLLAERIADPWLRELTASAAAASIPVLLGGHTLVGPGVRLVIGGTPAAHAVEVTPGIRRDPVPDLDAVGQDEDLVARIHEEIARDGPITFARFMDLALYDPDGGYYRAEAARPGRDGDFLTAPEAHPIFGAALARAVADAWDRLGRPETFVLREYGAGTGTLALAILDGLAAEHPDLAARLRYDPIEIEPRRLAAIATRLEAAGHGDALIASDRSGAPAIGFVLANEVLDALPVHRVVVRDGSLREVLVGSRDGAFVDVEAEPTTPDLAARLADESIELAEGQRAEICLALGPWLADAAAGLERGVLLLIDYGYPAAELYDPIRRRDGTLRAYLRHRVHDDPYIHVGRQDLTAHVDVSAVERAAAAAGLDAPRHDDPGRVPRRPRHGGPPPGDPGRPGDDPRGVPRRPVRADAAARPGRDGPVPGDGLRPRLAGRPAARGARVPARTPGRSRQTDRTRIGTSTYCRSCPPRATIRHGRARPDGERRANLHARSARAAPRHLRTGPPLRRPPRSHW